MKYFPLVWSGLWRNRVRTIFTLLSIVVAFLLFGLLQGVNHAFNGALESANIDRLLVSSRFSFLEPLPIGLLRQIETVPGIARVSYLCQFSTYYQEPKNQILVTPGNLDQLLKSYPEILVPKDQVLAASRTRTGALVGKLIADGLGLKVGDKLPLHSSVLKQDGSSDWTFDVAGIFDAPESPGLAGLILANYDYFDEARLSNKGTVLRFVIQVQDPARALQVASGVDRLFANSANETKTQSQKEYSQSLMKQFGDVGFLFDAIIVAVFFALLFVTANTMAQSARERIAEFAVLKTLGFSDLGVMALVLCEAALLCGVAALIGLAMSSRLVPALTGAAGIPIALPPKFIVIGMATALLLALISALPPAWRAKRLAVVDALAER